MTEVRLTLAQSWSALCASLLLFACGSSHGIDDAGPVDAGPGVDATLEPDAHLPPVDAGGPHASCSAEDASAEICPEILCDGPPTWHWNGERCVQMECGACVGADCERAWTSSRMDCEAEHAGCEPALCRATSGTWRWWDELCGHYVCGEVPLAICEVGAPACDCGYGRNFVPGEGCQADAACPAVDPLPMDVLCTATGGTMAATCCPSECGQACPRDCAALACTCGPMEIFDSIRGCTLGARCMERLPGERCEGGARCEGGTICCDRCGGAGCAGEPTCIVPVCDPDPDIDTCGNNRLAP